MPYAVITIWKCEGGIVSEVEYDNIEDIKEAESKRIDTLAWYKNFNPQNIHVVGYTV